MAKMTKPCISCHKVGKPVSAMTESTCAICMGKIWSKGIIAAIGIIAGKKYD